MSVHTRTCLRGGGPIMSSHTNQGAQGSVPSTGRVGAAAVGKAATVLSSGSLRCSREAGGPKMAWGRSIPTSGSPDESRHTFYENSVGQGSIGASPQKRLLLHNREKPAWLVMEQPRARVGVLRRAPAQVSRSQGGQQGAAPAHTPVQGVPTSAPLSDNWMQHRTHWLGHFMPGSSLPCPTQLHPVMLPSCPAAAPRRHTGPRGERSHEASGI